MRDASPKAWGAGVASGVVLGLCALGVSQTAKAASINFDNLPAGTIVTNQYLVSHGVRISGESFDSTADVATLYNSNRTGEPDPDLQIPWAMGNLAGQTLLNNVCIVPENMTDANGDGLIDQPNDEGARPAGQISFDFTIPVTSFGFDLLDVDGPAEYNRNAGFIATFLVEGVEAARVGFGMFVSPGSSFYDPTVVYGDNSANRIRPLTARELGVTAFDQVIINFGGSGAIDNITFTPIPPVPEPSGLALLTIPAAALLRRRRR